MAARAAGGEHTAGRTSSRETPIQNACREDREASWPSTVAWHGSTVAGSQPRGRAAWRRAILALNRVMEAPWRGTGPEGGLPAGGLAWHGSVVGARSRGAGPGEEPRAGELAWHCGVVWEHGGGEPAPRESRVAASWPGTVAWYGRRVAWRCSVVWGTGSGEPAPRKSCVAASGLALYRGMGARLWGAGPEEELRGGEWPGTLGWYGSPVVGSRPRGGAAWRRAAWHCGVVWGPGCGEPAPRKSCVAASGLAL